MEIPSVEQQYHGNYLSQEITHTDTVAMENNE